MYRCPWCGQPRRYLYPLTLVGRRLVAYQGPRCRGCAGLAGPPRERTVALPFRPSRLRSARQGALDARCLGSRGSPVPYHIPECSCSRRLAVLPTE
jgi:hypothetical protein